MTKKRLATEFGLLPSRFMNIIKQIANWLKNNILNVIVFGLTIFCVFSILNKLDDTFTVITNSLAIFVATWYFVKFEKEKIDRIIIKPIKQSHPDKIKATNKRGQNIIYFISTFFKQYPSFIVRLLYKKRWGIISWIFILLFLVIILNQLFDLNLVKKYQTLTTVLAILLGGLTFWHSRKRIKSEAEIEKNEEKLNEQKRLAEFSIKFPKINKIPILKKIIKWMYKEGLKYSLGFIIIIALGFLLRIYQLGNLNLLVEEQFHYSPAVNLATNGQPKMFYTSPEYYGYVNYYRSFLYTSFTALIFKTFGVSEFNLRILAVLLSLLTTIIIYLLSKEIFNKKFALFSITLFSFSSWAIWYERWARHYVFDGFILILFIYFSYLAFFKYKTNKYLYFLLIPIILIPWVETGNYLYIFIVFIILLFALPKKEIVQLIKNKHIYFIIILSIINLVFNYKITSNYYITPPTKTIPIEQSTLNKILDLPSLFIKNIFPLKFDGYFIKLIWEFYPILVILEIFTIFFLILNLKKKKYYLFFSFPLILLILSFYDVSKTWSNVQFFMWEPRHFSMLIPLYLLFISVGFYFFIFKIFNSKTMKTVLFLFVFLTLFSLKPYNINYGEDISGTPYQVMAAEEFYSNIKEPILYIKSGFNNENDLIIFDTMEVMYRSYWDKEPDKRIGWDIDENEGLAESNVDNIITDNPIKLKEYIDKNLEQGKRVWLIESSYNNINHHSRVRKGQIRKFLETNGKECRIYSENLTSIYLFTNDCFKQ